MKVTFPLALGLVFLTLKLTGYVTWSWWLVLMPFYLLPAICLAIFLAVVPFGGWGWYARQNALER